MNRQLGFTLIELMIATFIATVLAALLFTSLYQINKFVPALDSLTQMNEKAALVHAQLERDLSGATVPQEYYTRQSGAPAQPAQKEEKGKKGEEQKKAKEAQAPATPTPKKPLEKIFYGTNKNGMLDQLTFITTNPLQVYWSAKAGSAKPRVARVTYSLKEDQAKKGGSKSYSLMRAESSNLEYEIQDKEAKDSKAYVIADGIKSVNVEYTALMPEPQKKESITVDAQKKTQEQTQSKEQQQEKKKKEIKKMKEWLGPQEKEKAAQPPAQGKEGEQEKLPLVPNQIEMTVTFWDTQKRRSFPFSLKMQIMGESPSKQSESRLMDSLKDLMGTAFPPKPPPNTTFASNTPRPSSGRGRG